MIHKSHELTWTMNELEMFYFLKFIEQSVGWYIWKLGKDHTLRVDGDLWVEI
jgi:hypothetical protein